MTYSISISTLVLVTIGSLLIGAVAYWFKRRNDRRGIVDYRPHIGIGISAIFLVLLVPTMAHDRVVLTDTELRRMKGFWFWPETETLALKNVSSIEITDSVSHDFRGRTRHREIWIATYTNGTKAEIESGDLMKASKNDIMERLRASGIRIY
ncbi:hypothetical protein GCM10027431_09680 [Lysobacter rhizosphaerae]